MPFPHNAIPKALLLAALLTVNASPILPQAKPDLGSRVTVTGRLSRETVPRDELLRYWITIENNSDRPLLSVHRDRLEGAGFDEQHRCWGEQFKLEDCGTPARPGPVCVSHNPSRQAPADKDALCAYLGPHEALTVWGDLKAVQDLAPHQLIAVVSWDLGSAPKTSDEQQNEKKKGDVSQASELARASRYVALGSAEPVDYWRYFFRRYTPKADVSIPGAITIIGLFFTIWSGIKERKNENFTKMLENVHQFTMHFYMPTASVANAAAANAGKYCSACALWRSHGTPVPDEAHVAARVGYYNLMMFHWWQRETFQKVGAYHLGTRTGEAVLARLAGKHLLSLVGTDEEMRRSLERVKSGLLQETTLNDFLESLDDGLDPDLTLMWRTFDRWAGSANSAAYLGNLEAFVAVMYYEANSISKDWYAGRAELDLSARAKPVLQEFATDSVEIAGYLRLAKRGFRIPFADRFGWRAVDFIRVARQKAPLHPGSWF